MQGFLSLTSFFPLSLCFWLSLFIAGLKRCGKSCRLRWLNYLRPNIKHGQFSEAEDKIICSLFASIGSRYPSFTEIDYDAPFTFPTQMSLVRSFPKHENRTNNFQLKKQPVFFFFHFFGNRICKYNTDMNMMCTFRWSASVLACQI